MPLYKNPLTSDDISDFDTAVGALIAPTVTDVGTKVTGSGFTTATKITRPAYRALTTPDPNTLYSIVPQAQDDFGRTATSSWGTADSGQTWSTVNTANFNIATPGIATSVHATAGLDNYATLGSFSALEQEHEIWFSLASAVTGTSFFMFSGLRWASTTQNYRVRVELTTSGVVKLIAQNVIGGTPSDYGTAVTLPITYTAGMVLALRTVVTGASPTRIMARCWDASKVEPITWNIDTTPTVTVETLLQSASGAAIYTRSGASSTPLPNTFSFYRYRII